MLAPTPIKPSFKVNLPIQPAALHSGPAHCYKKLIRRRERRQLQSEMEAIASFCFAQKNNRADRIKSRFWNGGRPNNYCFTTTSYTNFGRKIRALRRSRSCKVTDFGIKRKPMYNFLLVINTNLPPILHRFRDIAFDRSNKNRYISLLLLRLCPPPR